MAYRASRNEFVTMWFTPKDEKQREAYELAREDIKALLLVSKEGVNAAHVMNFLEDQGSCIKFKEMGFSNFNELLFHCQDFLDVRVYPPNRGYPPTRFLFVRPSSVDPESLHVLTMVQNQIAEKKKKRNDNPRPVLKNLVYARPEALLENIPRYAYEESFQENNPPPRGGGRGGYRGGGGRGGRGNGNGYRGRGAPRGRPDIPRFRQPAMGPGPSFLREPRQGAFAPTKTPVPLVSALNRQLAVGYGTQDSFNSRGTDMTGMCTWKDGKWQSAGQDVPDRAPGPSGRDLGGAGDASTNRPAATHTAPTKPTMEYYDVKNRLASRQAESSVPAPIKTTKGYSLGQGLGPCGDPPGIQVEPFTQLPKKPEYEMSDHQVPRYPEARLSNRWLVDEPSPSPRVVEVPDRVARVSIENPVRRVSLNPFSAPYRAVQSRISSYTVTNQASPQVTTKPAQPPVSRYSVEAPVARTPNYAPPPPPEYNPLVRNIPLPIDDYYDSYSDEDEGFEMFSGSTTTENMGVRRAAEELFTTVNRFTTAPPAKAVPAPTSQNDGSLPLENIMNKLTLQSDSGLIPAGAESRSDGSNYVLTSSSSSGTDDKDEEVVPERKIPEPEAPEVVPAERNGDVDVGIPSGPRVGPTEHDPRTPILPVGGKLTQDGEELTQDGNWNITDLEVVSFESPTMILVRAGDPALRDLLTRLEELMTQFYSKMGRGEVIPREDLIQFGYYAAFDIEEGRWCRVQVDLREIVDDTVKVLRIDHGDTRMIQFQDLTYLKTSYARQMGRQSFYILQTYVPDQPRLTPMAERLIMVKTVSKRFKFKVAPGCDLDENSVPTMKGRFKIW